MKGGIVMKYEVPIYKKSNLTLEEAAAYFGIGVNKLRELSDDDKCTFVLWVGSCYMKGVSYGNREKKR